MTKTLKHPWCKRATLFVGMYLITAGVIWFESGSLLSGLTFGLLSSTFKTGWALAHSWLHEE